MSCERNKDHVRRSYHETVDEGNREIYMRHIIETERVDIFDVNMMIVMQLRLNAEAGLEELRKAFDGACAVHEVLHSKVVIEASGDAYYVDNDEPQNSFTQTESDLRELIYQNERRRFRIEKGEFIRGFSSPDGLIFMMHHLGGDGKSLLYFIESFMRILSGEECEAVPFRNLTLADLPPKSRLPVLYDVLIKIWNRKWQRIKRSFDIHDLDEAFSAFWKEHKTGVEIKRYEKNELEDMLRQAKKAGVSLTAYLITEWIKDAGKETDIGLAVGGREDGNRSMGNQATGISVQYRYRTNRSFEENAREVHRRMLKKLSDERYLYFVLQFMGKLDPTLKDAMNMERSGYFTSAVSSKVAGLLGYGDKVRDISITNLTKADIPLKYGRYSIEDIVFVPPVVSYGKNIIGIVTAGDVMNIARHVYT